MRNKLNHKRVAPSATYAAQRWIILFHVRTKWQYNDLFSMYVLVCAIVHIPIRIQNIFHSEKKLFHHTLTNTFKCFDIHRACFEAFCEILLNADVDTRFITSTINQNWMLCVSMMVMMMVGVLVVVMYDSLRMSFTIHVLIQFSLYRETNKLAKKKMILNQKTTRKKNSLSV